MKIDFKKAVSLIVILAYLFMTNAVAFGLDKITFYHTDQVGTPLAMTNHNGDKIIWEAEYMPFGEEYTVFGVVENNKRFVGKEKDEETGLSYFGARYMDVEIGRFLAPDPVRAVGAGTGEINMALLANPQRLNPYAYSMNNPYKYVDPDGKDPGDIVLFTKTQGYASLIGTLSPGGSYGHSAIEVPGNLYLTADSKRGVHLSTPKDTFKDAEFDIYRPNNPVNEDSLLEFAKEAVIKNKRSGKGYNWSGLLGISNLNVGVNNEYTCSEVVSEASAYSGNNLGYMGLLISPNEISKSESLKRLDKSKKKR